MPEPLTTSLVLEELKRLHVAFPQNIGMRTNPAQTAEVYRNGLRGLSGDAVRAAADRAIQEHDFFPKVAQLREIATSWMRHNQPSTALVDSDPMYCHLCGTKAVWSERWRPMANARGGRILTPDKVHILLETYTRLRCECAPPSDYRPIDGLTPPQMHIEDIGKRPVA